MALLAILWACSGPVVIAGKDDDKKAAKPTRVLREARGVLTEVRREGFTVMHDGDPSKLSHWRIFEDQTNIMCDGMPINLVEMPVGATLIIGGLPSENVAIKIKFVNPKRFGTIRSVDPKKRSFSVALEGEKDETTFQLSGRAKISVENKDGQLADLNTGSRVVILISSRRANEAIEVIAEKAIK
jgi:hypothetical protein